MLKSTAIATFSLFYVRPRTTEDRRIAAPFRTFCAASTRRKSVAPPRSATKPCKSDIRPPAPVDNDIIVLASVGFHEPKNNIRFSRENKQIETVDDATEALYDLECLLLYYILSQAAGSCRTGLDRGPREYRVRVK